MNARELTELAVSCGATSAALMQGSQIVLNAEYRAMCEANRCGVYGKCYMCPPDAGPIDELMARITRYKNAILFQIVTQLEDSFDIEGMTAARKNLVKVSERLRDQLIPLLPAPTLLLSAGGCGICEECGKVSGVPCRFPERAMASLESYGIDVSRTSRNAGLRYNNGAGTVTYFGMILFGACCVIQDAFL